MYLELKWVFFWKFPDIYLINQLSLYLPVKQGKWSEWSGAKQSRAEQSNSYSEVEPSGAEQSRAIAIVKWSQVEQVEEVEQSRVE